MRTRHFYEFGPFCLEPSEHLLLRQGEAVTLAPKAFDLLVFLVQNQQRLVTKEEIMQALWPESFVEEANLTVNMSALRRALGGADDAVPYIETVPKKGYRFKAPVREVGGESEGNRLSQRDAGSHSVPAGGAAADSAQRMLAVSAPAAGAEPIQASAKAGARMPAALPVLAASVTALLLALVYLAHRRQSRAGETSGRPQSLAILPFQNLRQDADSDFLGLSLADAVITKLGYVSALTVRPSSTISKYRNQVVDMPKVAAELNVDSLLTGTFIRDGQALRITAQLVDARGNKVLWTDTFNLKYEKLLTVQDDVAQEIIKGLELHLPRSEAERLKPGAPIDPLAYEYYLRGVDLYSRGDFSMAIRMLEKSAEIDANYPLTWAHLGRSYTAAASFEFGGRELYRKAEAAYDKALSLQPAPIEAQVWRANLFTDTGRAEDAVPLLRRALATNPSHAEAHWELGYAYRFAGMLRESVAECEGARQLDPGVKLTSSALNSYLYLGQYDRFLESLPTNSDSGLIVFYRGFAHYYKKDWDQAATDFDRAFALEPSKLQAQVGRALAEGIRRRASSGLEVLREAENRVEERGVGDPEAIYKIAQAYATLGDKGSALRVLRHSIENGFFCYPYFTTDPLLDSLRDEAEFRQLLDLARRRHEAFKSRFS